MPRKMKRDIISGWDKRLFTYLASVKVALIEQIERDIPHQYKNRPSLVCKLWRLRKRGLLSAQYSRMHDGKKVLCLTKKAFDKYLSNGLEVRKQLKSDKVDHDLDLVDIRYCFNQSKLVTQILTENDLQTWPEYYQRDEIRAFVKINSDSAINVQFPNGSFWIALEYESTAKNKSRYASLFQNYYAHEEVTAVIYVCQSKSILNKLMKEEKDFIGDNRRKFFYKTLEDLKQDRTMTFTNGLSEKLILADKSEK